MADIDIGSAAPEHLIADRYRVVRVLGEGSSARTVLCHDPTEDRHVAIKELHFEHLEDWKHLELFERESKVLALLEHAGIPAVYDFFHDPGDSTALFIVQEYVEGISLAERLESGPMLSQQEVEDVAKGLLGVLDYLHGRAPPVLHRDIKPSNVLLRPDGSPVLIDFGGVRYGWRASGTEGATVVGTFGYMPPEQLLGQAAPTSDLYALGATLLHLLSGKPPSEFPFDSGRIEVPSDLPGPQRLTRLVEALLRPAPRDRPGSAAEALRMLAEPVAAPTSDSSALTTRPPNRPPERRHVTIISEQDYGPSYVDVGPPPRDPEGEFRDVYRNLVNPLFPARRLWSPVQHFGWVAVSGLLILTTFGIAPALYLASVRKRKHRYTALFRTGVTTRGVIVAGKTKDVYARFKYEFEVGGTTYVTYMEYAAEMLNFWSEGDSVPVLYDESDPSSSCFVYR